MTQEGGLGGEKCRTLGAVLSLAKLFVATVARRAGIWA